MIVRLFLAKLLIGCQMLSLKPDFPCFKKKKKNCDYIMLEESKDKKENSRHGKNRKQTWLSHPRMTDNHLALIAFSLRTDCVPNE